MPSPDSFTARATDLETWVSQSTKVAQVQSAGRALVNAERLLAVAKEMTDDAISLETQGDHLHVRGARAHFKLLAMKPQDFPPFPEAAEAEPFLVKATDLRRMVGQTAFAASRENSQYARAAVLFRVAQGKLTLAATDARRLAEATCGVETTTEAEAMIPPGDGQMLTLPRSNRR